MFFSPRSEAIMFIRKYGILKFYCVQTIPEIFRNAKVSQMPTHLCMKFAKFCSAKLTPHTVVA